MFVILGLRTKSFRTFIKRFSTIFKTAVYVSTDKFCGKKKFMSTGFWAKGFYLFSMKVWEGFQNCICVSTWIFWEKLLNVLENKKLYLIFFRFFFLNLSGNLLKLHSKWPEDIFWGKRLLETPQNCLSFLRPEANHFWIFGKPFSIRLSKLHFMCPNKRFVEKS